MLRRYFFGCWNFSDPFNLNLRSLLGPLASPKDCGILQLRLVTATILSLFGSAEKERFEAVTVVTSLKDHELKLTASI